MMEAVIGAVRDQIDLSDHDARFFRSLETIQCHHNFTEKEHHHGQDVWLTRKGAIRARVGDKGIIPGSMGTATYIVEGLGNPSSYFSASHGAGRVLSRGAAKRELDEEMLEVQMEGIVWNRDTKGLLDEDPRAYKNIETVMDNQKDLVEPVHRLIQVLNYKGQ